MSPKPSELPPALVPRWLLVVGSLAILFHFFAILTNVLAAPSGPWPSFEGPRMEDPPQLPLSINTAIGPPYLRPIRMTHNYHFNSNRTSNPSIRLEVRLKDEAGNLLTTVTLPDPNANPWVYHRQEMLVRWLSEDMPVMASTMESIPAPGQQARKVAMWDREPGDKPVLKLIERPEHLVPKDRPVLRPNDWAMLLVHSYVRYLCREHNAAKAEVIRHSKQPLPAAILLMPTMQLPPEATEELLSNFGELSR